MYSTFYLSMQYCNIDNFPKIMQKSIFFVWLYWPSNAFCFNRVRIVDKQQDPSRNCNEEAFPKITQIN